MMSKPRLRARQFMVIKKMVHECERVRGDWLMVDEDVSDHENGIYTGVVRDDGFVKRLVTGVVALVGGGRSHPDMWGIRPGDVIVYSPVGSRKFQIWGKSMTFIRLSSVAGVVE